MQTAIPLHLYMDHHHKWIIHCSLHLHLHLLLHFIYLLSPCLYQHHRAAAINLILLISSDPALYSTKNRPFELQQCLLHFLNHQSRKTISLAQQLQLVQRRTRRLLIVYLALVVAALLHQMFLTIFYLKSKLSKAQFRKWQTKLSIQRPSEACLTMTRIMNLNYSQNLSNQFSPNRSTKQPSKTCLTLMMRTNLNYFQSLSQNRKTN